MNPRDLDSVSLLLPDEIERARKSAQGSGKAVVEMLQEVSGLQTEQFVQALGATLGYEVVGMDQLDRLSPAFDLEVYLGGWPWEPTFSRRLREGAIRAGLDR